VKVNPQSFEGIMRSKRFLLFALATAIGVLSLFIGILSLFVSPSRTTGKFRG
jgi:hypothetical protein